MPGLVIGSSLSFVGEGWVGATDAGAGAYNLDAAAATYTWTATAAGLEFDRLLDAAAASYTWTATDAGLSYGYKLTADAASYTWTAADAGLVFDRQVAADAAAYLWNATDADLIYTPSGTAYNLDADSAAYAWTAQDAGLEYVPVSAPAAARAPGGITHRRKRRRILLDDGRIWVPATEEDFQDYIAALIRSFEAKLPPPLDVPATPRKRRYKAAVKSLAEIPKLMLARPLPGGFYETLANNAADVLTSRMLADAWEAYAAEMDEDEAVTMLLLS